ncbi:DNA polymerase III subunit beta [Paraflavitalea sp. CAU 1676]|uniref:DNA polymerase III subunit beta n=1 Tax=Paraflavitalea sp. CAU 1676 TaxID=3032598 RepID=UPI0023DBBF84|nr:DNA polymerase III subunit beta [Paraflavitalea sp. CAU 1676]MDF2189320.1 DNA polymerase III subunit beta [Paraflavitalea sp. CAU 1676]
MIISQEHLKPALKKLGQAVPAKPVIPATSNLLCRVSGNEVELVTTDLELTIIYKCPCESEEGPFEILLPFDFLKKVVALTGHMPITIEHPAEKRARIVAGEDVYDLKSLEPVADFPKLPNIPKKNSVKLSPETMKRVIASMQACSHDDLRPSMTYSCLDIEDGKITIVATDAQILYRYEVVCDPAIPKDQVLVSQKLAAALDGAGDTELYWQKKHAAFKAENLTVIITRQESKFPDYRVAIPNHEANLEVNRNELITSLEKVLLGNSKSCLLHPNPDRMKITANDMDLEREVESVVAGVYSGDTKLFSLNPKRLITLLSQVEYDRVALHIDSPRRAVLLSSQEDSNYLGLIMPLLID